MTRVGTRLFNPDELQRLDAGTEPRWTLLPGDGGDDFVVFRLFDPVRRRAMFHPKAGAWPRLRQTMQGAEAPTTAAAFKGGAI